MDTEKYMGTRTLVSGAYKHFLIYVLHGHRLNVLCSIQCVWLTTVLLG